jgi:hypothetical protein
VQPDPEALFVLSAWMSHVDDVDRALLALTRAVRGRFFAVETLARHPVFAPLHDVPAFRGLRRHAERPHDAAWIAFRDAGGEELLGLQAAGNRGGARP